MKHIYCNCISRKKFVFFFKFCVLFSGQWKFGVKWSLGQDIAKSTVGIVGLGGVGQAIVRRLKGFDVARFIYSGRSDKPEGISEI